MVHNVLITMYVRLTEMRGSIVTMVEIIFQGRALIYNYVEGKFSLHYTWIMIFLNNMAK